MIYKFEVEVSVERIEGRFASREDIGDQITEALEAANYDSWDGEHGGTYETVDWEVREVER